MASSSEKSATPPAVSPRWLDVELASVEENLALDEALLEAAHEGRLPEPVVRTWMASKPTIVLGSSSRVSDEVALEACAASGVRLVRRPSGGLTVVLGPGCLMWSVVAAHPLAAPALGAIHAAMLEPLAAALRSAGRPVERCGTSDLAITTADGPRKVSGNALRVKRHGVLYHGTLLDSFDIGLVGRVLRHPPAEPGYRAGRPHGEFLANLSIGRIPLEQLVRQAFRAEAPLEAWPAERIAALVAERYASHEWTHRL